jgi:hypothetical protein
MLICAKAARDAATQTLIDLPETFALVAKAQQPIFWIVPLGAPGADQVTAPGRALTVIIFGDGEGHSATARNEKHLQRRVGLRLCN